MDTRSLRLNLRSLKLKLCGIPRSDLSLYPFEGQLFYGYMTNKLHYLLDRLSEGSSVESDIKNLLGEIDDFYEIKRELSYNYSPKVYLNQACFAVATFLEPVLGINRYQLIMPRLAVLSSVITMTDLSTTDLPFHQFIQSGDRFIEILPCLATSVSDGVLKHTTLNGERADALTEDEADLVINHSRFTRAFWRAIQRKNKIEKKGFSFGAALTRLADGLTEGSVTDLGEVAEEKAGNKANLAILKFGKWLTTLTETEREMLMERHYQGMHDTVYMKDIWGRLENPRDPKYTGEIKCTDLSKDDVNVILEQNPDLFEIFPSSSSQHHAELFYDGLSEAKEDVRLSGEELQQAMQGDYQATYKFYLAPSLREAVITRLFSSADFQKFATAELARQLLSDLSLYHHIKRVLTDAEKESSLLEWLKPHMHLIDHYKSVLSIRTTSYIPDYLKPWSRPQQEKSAGAGVVIERDGKKYVLTLALYVKNPVKIMITLEQQDYEATCKCVCDVSGLALLQIDNPEFQQNAVAAQLGEMVTLQEAAEVVGFSAYDDELNADRGVISGMVVNAPYDVDVDMLYAIFYIAENRARINLAGPVFADRKMVGVYLLNYGNGENYVIPMPVIQHFLTEAFRPLFYRGFPALPFEIDQLKHPLLRASYGMLTDQTGVRIERISAMCDAHGKLQSDDILLEMDGLQVSNEGTVAIPGIGVVKLSHVVRSKYVGDSVQLKVLRKNIVDGQHETHNLTVVLNRSALELTKVAKELNKMSTYFIASGICFMPLTHDYLDVGSELEDFIDRDTGRRIVDDLKESLGEQYVVISAILPCEATEGYDGFVDMIVREVNGVEINHIGDVIEAMEANAGSSHTIITNRGRVIVKKMSVEETAKLFKDHDVAADRSEDLGGPAIPVEEREEHSDDFDDLGDFELAMGGGRPIHALADMFLQMNQAARQRLRFFPPAATGDLEDEPLSDEDELSSGEEESAEPPAKRARHF